MFISFSMMILFAPVIWASLKSITLILKYLKQNKISEFSNTNKFTPKKLLQKIKKLVEYEDEIAICYMVRGMLEKNPITGKFVIEITKKPSEEENEALVDYISTFKKHDIVFLYKGKILSK